MAKMLKSALKGPRLHPGTSIAGVNARTRARKAASNRKAKSASNEKPSKPAKPGHHWRQHHKAGWIEARNPGTPKQTHHGKLVAVGKARAKAAKGEKAFNPVTGRKIANSDASDHIRAAKNFAKQAKKFPSTSNRFKQLMGDHDRHMKIAAKKSKK